MLKSFLEAPILLAILLGLATATAAEPEKDVENKAYMLCKHKKEVRTIRVQISESGICSTYYSKLGEEKRVGSGQNHGSCITFMDNIKTNLEKSNWTCRDINDTKITAITED